MRYVQIMASSMLFKIALVSCLLYLAVAKTHDKKAQPAPDDSGASSDSSASTGASSNSSASTAGTKVFDVTKYSGSTSASASVNSKAFTDAFTAACAVKERTTFLVPPGTYQLGPVKFEGPCPSSHVTFDIKGTLVAPPDVNAFPGPAWIEFDALHELVVQGGGILDGQGEAAWKNTRRDKAITMRFMKCFNGIVNNLTFKNSKYFHIALHHTQGLILKDLKIMAPGNSKNTDGVHLSGSNNITMTNLDIGTGDDCISVGPGTYNVTISGSKCGPGHGFSIGSLGKYKDEENVGNIHFTNCTVLGATNGLRIKTWPGAPPSEAYNITFEDVALTNVSNPIIIDQKYCPNGICTTNAPSQVKLRDITFCRIKGTSNTPVAVKLDCSEKAPCQNVNLQDISLAPLTSVLSEVKAHCANVVGGVKGVQKPDPCLGDHAESNPKGTTSSDSSPPSEL